jgi:hypothetical protein
MNGEFISVDGANRPLDAPTANGDGQTLPGTLPPNHFQRQLLRHEQVCVVLQLNPEQVQFLINTQQIVRIRIAGEERFDTRDLDRLIDTYKATALRRAE